MKTVKIIIVALAIMLYAHRSSAGPFIRIDSVDHAEFPLIKMYVTAQQVDSSTIAGLNEENLFIYEDGFRVNYVRVMNKPREGDFVYLVFSLDSSKSISRAYMAKIKQAARGMVNSAGPEDKIAVYRFNNEVITLNTFTSNRADILKSIDSVERHGSRTLLFDGVYDAIDILSREKTARRAVIVFTDGKDEGSSINTEDIVKFAREYGVPVYFICMRNTKNARSLRRIAKLTGGISVQCGEVRDIAAVYRRILSMIKGQYVVQYRTMVEPDRRKHMVEVRLKYDAIRDRDSREVVYKKPIINLNLSYLYTALTILGIALAVIGMGLLVSIAIKKGKHLLHQRQEDEHQPVRKHRREAETPREYRFYKEVIQEDEDERTASRPTIGPDDPEYVYARAWLVEKDGPETGKKFPVHWDEITIGRDEESTIIVRDEAVSPKHAKIKRVKDAYYLYDLVSENGTLLNGKKLLRPKPLYDWDEIKIGRTVFLFRGSKMS